MTDKYVIRDRTSRTYYRGRCAIGPYFGGTLEQAHVFDGEQAALMETSSHPIAFVLADVLPAAECELEAAADSGRKRETATKRRRK